MGKGRRCPPPPGSNLAPRPDFALSHLRARGGGEGGCGNSPGWGWEARGSPQRVGAPWIDPPPQRGVGLPLLFSPLPAPPPHPNTDPSTAPPPPPRQRPDPENKTSCSRPSIGHSRTKSSLFIGRPHCHSVFVTAAPAPLSPAHAPFSFTRCPRSSGSALIGRRRRKQGGGGQWERRSRVPHGPATRPRRASAGINKRGRGEGGRAESIKGRGERRRSHSAERRGRSVELSGAGSAAKLRQFRA